MKRSVNLSQFIQAFKDYDRDYYTYEAYELIYNELEELTEGEYELDVIAICGEYDEYTEKDLANDYGSDNTFNNLNEDLQERLVGFTGITAVIRAY